MGNQLDEFSGTRTNKLPVCNLDWGRMRRLDWGTGMSSNKYGGPSGSSWNPKTWLEKPELSAMMVLKHDKRNTARTRNESGIRILSQSDIRVATAKSKHARVRGARGAVLPWTSDNASSKNKQQQRAPPQAISFAHASSGCFQLRRDCLATGPHAPRGVARDLRPLQRDAHRG
jgi:hypothetical protein